jgi:uncharacterized protein
LPREDNPKILSWTDVESLCESVAAQIIASKYDPDIVIGLLWGGAIPTRIIMDMANINREKVIYIETKYYNGTKRKKEVEVMFDHDKLWVGDKKILVIDDIYDTGNTITALEEKLTSKVQRPKSVKIATLVYKGMQPKNSYSAFGIQDKLTWIVFPWEKEEYRKEKINE